MIYNKITLLAHRSKQEATGSRLVNAPTKPDDRLLVWLDILCRCD